MRVLSPSTQLSIGIADRDHVAENRRKLKYQSAGRLSKPQVHPFLASKTKQAAFKAAKVVPRIDRTCSFELLLIITTSKEPITYKTKSNYPGYNETVNLS